jgi:hypothetical protein
MADAEVVVVPCSVLEEAWVVPPWLQHDLVVVLLVLLVFPPTLVELVLLQHDLVPCSPSHDLVVV